MNLALIGVALSELFSTDSALYIGVVSGSIYPGLVNASNLT